MLSNITLNTVAIRFARTHSEILSSLGPHYLKCNHWLNLMETCLLEEDQP